MRRRSPSSRCHSLYGTNITGNLELEIVTGGWSTKVDGRYGELRLWQLDASGFLHEIAWPKQWHDHDGFSPADVIVNGVFARDVDGDDIVEVVSGGQGKLERGWEAQLRTWHDP